MGKKILNKRIFVFLCILWTILFLTPMAFAGDLELSSVRVYIDGTRETSADENGGNIDNDVIPGSKIKLKFSLKNTFSRDDNIDIDNIYIEGTLKDIDLGADLELTSDEYTIESSKSKTIDMTFIIPDIVEEDSYRLEFKIEGEDDDDKNYDLEVDYWVYVIKEEHDIRIVEASIDKKDLKCGETAQLTVKMQNFGSDEETNTKLKVINPELLVSYASITSLSDNINDKNNAYVRKYPIIIPKDAIEGEHIISISAYYHGTIKSDSKTVQIVVNCSEETQTTELNNEIKPQETNNQIKINQNNYNNNNLKQDDDSKTIVLREEDTNNSKNKKEKGFFSKYKWVFIIIIINILIIGSTTGAIYYINKKDKHNSNDDDEDNEEGILDSGMKPKIKIEKTDLDEDMQEITKKFEMQNQINKKPKKPMSYY